MKRMISRLLAVVLCFAMVLSLAACGGVSDDKFYKENDPIQVTDGAGRKVSFEKPAETIATSWGGTVDPYLFALGLGDKLVATNASNDFHKLFVDLESMKSVGRWALDKEALAEISPDLFIHSMGCADYLKDANKVGVRSIGLGLNKFEDIENNLTMLGKVFGVEERAAEVIAECNRIKELVDSRVSSVSESDKPTVVVLAEETGSVASDIHDTIEVMISGAGGISVVPEDIAMKTEITNVGLEKIFGWNPDFVFLQSYYCELTVDGIMADPTWKSMTSVQNSHVYAIPSDLDSWSSATPSCYLGMLYMSMQMYPDLYKDIDFSTEVINFYKAAYGVELTYEQLGIK